jgi:hypothetical protein
MDIIVLLLLLQIKHWYADFKIQTYMQTVKKGVWLDPIGISHTIDHMWCSLAVLLPVSLFSSVTVTAILAAVAVEGITHYLIDYTKVKYGCKDNTKPLFWNQFGLDQLAHQVCYLTMVVYLLNLI